MALYPLLYLTYLEAIHLKLHSLDLVFLISLLRLADSKMFRGKHSQNPGKEDKTTI